MLDGWERKMKMRAGRKREVAVGHNTRVCVWRKLGCVGDRH